MSDQDRQVKTVPYEVFVDLLDLLESKGIISFAERLAISSGNYERHDFDDQ